MVSTKPWLLQLMAVHWYMSSVGKIPNEPNFCKITYFLIITNTLDYELCCQDHKHRVGPVTVQGRRIGYCRHDCQTCHRPSYGVTAKPSPFITYTLLHTATYLQDARVKHAVVPSSCCLQIRPPHTVPQIHNVAACSSKF
jgi:hypothetical protein